jgi:hypothetical protein
LSPSHQHGASLLANTLHKWKRRKLSFLDHPPTLLYSKARDRNVTKGTLRINACVEEEVYMDRSKDSALLRLMGSGEHIHIRGSASQIGKLARILRLCRSIAANDGNRLAHLVGVATASRTGSGTACAQSRWACDMPSEGIKLVFTYLNAEDRDNVRGRPARTHLESDLSR